MSALDLLDRLAGGAVDRAFGEVVTVIPRSGGRIAAASDDPSRPQKTVTAVFADAPSEMALFQNRMNGLKEVGTTGVLIPGAVLSLSAAQAKTLGYELRKGDLVKLSARAGTPRYAVSSPPQADDLGAVVLMLAREEALP